MHSKNTKTAFSQFSSYSRLLLKAITSPLPLYIALSGNLILAVGTTLFFKYEKGVNPQVQHWFDALWWAFCTVSTVGYGDITPTTVLGRVVGIVLMVTGVTFFVSFTGVMVTILSSLAAEDISRKERAVLDAMAQVLEKLGSIQKSISELNQKKG